VRHVFPVFDLLDAMVISGEEKVIKPKPGIYNILLNRYNLVPSESVFIDDNLNNIKGAQAVGMHGIQFTNKEALVGPLEALLQEK
jgi:HAD superfamily hydrolase (TIGR01509 family)